MIDQLYARRMVFMESQALIKRERCETFSLVPFLFASVVLRNSTCRAEMPGLNDYMEDKIIMKITEAIYDGKLFPKEQVMAGNKDYKEKLGKLDEMMVELQYDLTGEEYAAVEKIIEQMIDINGMETVETFRYGLAAGMKLMREVSEVPGLDGDI